MRLMDKGIVYIFEYEWAWDMFTHYRYILQRDEF